MPAQPPRLPIRSYAPVPLVVAAAAAVLFAAHFPVALAAPTVADADLERCRWLHAGIERYTRLRRAGGNTAQMERWRRARQAHEAEYRQKRCHRFGSRLVVRS